MERRSEEVGWGRVERERKEDEESDVGKRTSERMCVRGKREDRGWWSYGRGRRKVEERGGA